MPEVAAMGTAQLTELISAVGSMAPALDDADRIERIRQFENLKSAVAAAQVRETATFVASQRAAQAVEGVPVQRQGRGVAAQVGLARRVSPWQAQRYVGWAAVLTAELPRTFAALQAGRISEWRAMLVARETIWLSREDRAAVDAELAPNLEGWGDRQVEAETRRAAYRLDPQGFLDRVRGAEKDRRVTVRPAPDTMARLTALLPVAQAVAAYAVLGRVADTTTAGGDERGRGQIMADTLVERLTGQTTADAVPVEIELIMTDRALLADDDVEGSDEPGIVNGYGPIPAGLARQLALDGEAPRWLRRLFLHPTSGQLAAMETTARFFTANQRRFIRLREHHVCRTPWCGAPIRHADHVQPHVDGGPTHVHNGQGDCESCNYAKQAAGWSAGIGPDGGITTRTPTGHRYASRQPDPPGMKPTRRPGIRFASQVRIVDLVYHQRQHAA